jgi:hypothetical protein
MSARRNHPVIALSLCVSVPSVVCFLLFRHLTISEKLQHGGIFDDFSGKIVKILKKPPYFLKIQEEFEFVR